MRRPAAIVALALLAACGNQDPLTVSIGNRVVYSEAQVAAVPGAPPVPGAPGAAAVAGAPAPLRMPTITSNIPVFIGDRQVGGPVEAIAP